MIDRFCFDADLQFSRLVIHGNPHHGLITDTTLAAPSGNITVPAVAGGCTWLFEPGMPAVSRTPEQQAFDTAHGFRWDNHALLGGPYRTIHGGPAQCGESGWLYRDPDGITWAVSLINQSFSRTGATFGVRARLIGKLGAPAEQHDYGPFNLTWAEAATDYASNQPSYGARFQDQTGDGSKAAWLVLGNGGAPFWYDLAQFAFQVELSGPGDAMTVAATEYLSRSSHLVISTTDPNSYDEYPDSSWYVRDPENPGGPFILQADPHTISSTYAEYHITCFLFYVGATLKRLTARGYDASALVRWTLDSSGAYNGSTWEFLRECGAAQVNTSWLGFLLDGVDTGISLSWSRSGSTVTPCETSYGPLAVPVRCAGDGGALGNCAAELNDIVFSGAVTGDLGGLITSISATLQPQFNKAIRASVAISPDPDKWGFYHDAAAAQQMVRIEWRDVHQWVFALAEGVSHERIRRVVTPVNTAGHVVDMQTARTAYAIQQYQAAPYMAYDRKTGDFASHPSLRVCYL